MNKKELQQKKMRVRSKIVGDAKRPRLSVYKSSKYIYAQIIDDEKGVTIVAASDLKTDAKLPKTKRSEDVGTVIAKLAQAQKITKVRFDRGGFKYIGRIKSLAEAARKSGLEF